MKDSENFEPEFRKILKDALDSKRSANPRYSIRAFANFLEVDQSGLTKVLLSKGELSQKSMKRCLEKLQIASDRIEKILNSSTVKKTYYKHLEEDLFNVVADWKHFAILEYLSFSNKHETDHIASFLNLDSEETELALGRLEQFGFIKRKKNHFILSQPNNSWTSHKSSTEARKTLQKDLLRLSINAVDEVPFEYRDHGSLTVAVHREDMDEFKKILQDTRRKLAKLFQKNQDFDDVYQLTVSFFPLTNEWKNKT